MKKIMFWLLAIIGLGQSASAQMKTGEIVAVTSTEAGKVRGYIHNSVFTYKGIPYAQAKRFEAPQKAYSMARCSQFDDLRTCCAFGEPNNFSTRRRRICV
jgi:para-nitrobenzyl esterase